MNTNIFQSQLDDSEMRDSLLEGLTSSRFTEDESLSAPSMSMEEAVDRLRTGQTDFRNLDTAEAIIIVEGFKPLLIRDGTFETSTIKKWRDALDPNRATIDKTIANVGRVDVALGRRNFNVGTAWRIGDDTFVTNRHVAKTFWAMKSGGGYKVADRYKVYVDMAEGHDPDEEADRFVRSILHVEDRANDGIDLAVLRVDLRAADDFGDPIELSLSRKQPEVIAVIGYPGNVQRDNPDDAYLEYFEEIFDVKRLAPGHIMDFEHSPRVFTHNCTTLPGSSGSVIIDVRNGAAIGLHFKGRPLEQNHAVRADALEDALRRVSIPVDAIDEPAAREDGDDDTSEGRGLAEFSDRDGYDADFIGTGALSVPMPQLNALQRARVAKTKDRKSVLDYRHFSAVMNEARRLAYFVAVNIDGDDLRRPKRVDRFLLDPRLTEEQQAGEDLYRRNDLDRGHLVRRLDPTWGSKADAEQANIDSMYFPNIAPQHKRLNQRIWLDLEDHILSQTDDVNARISVFVGCLFDESDPEHRKTGIKVPMGYWKIVASSAEQARGGRGRSRRVLEAQAFTMFQRDFVKDSDLEMVFGAGFETYQVTVAELERLTGLDFHVLRDADTYRLPEGMRESQLESAALGNDPGAGFSENMQPLRSLNDVVTGKTGSNDR